MKDCLKINRGFSLDEGKATQKSSLEEFFSSSISLFTYFLVIFAKKLLSLQPMDIVCGIAKRIYVRWYLCKSEEIQGKCNW